MRAGLRWKMVLVTGGLWLMPASALAQETPPPATTNTPATDAIGPKELQNFSLPGTTTRPAEQPAPAPATAPPSRTAARPPTTEAPPAKSVAARKATRPTEAVTQAPPAQPVLAAPQPQPAQPSPVAAATPAFSPPVSTAPISPAATAEPGEALRLLPWIAAALALAAAAILLLWLRRPREAVAGSEFDLFAAPEPSPQPRPAPPPRPAPQPPRQPAPRAPSGIVASRLRPSMEIEIQPLRCLVEDSQVVVEFEVDLFNAGTAPARAVLAEASLFNVGPNQEQELAAFFANPVGEGNRIPAIPPMKRMSFTSQVVAPRSAIQEYELAGRKSFVPVIAFNTLYEWSGGKGQTSAAYLVGRDTGREKLGPLRLDRGPTAVRGLGARTLPTVLRT